jgi:1,4-dihydroxy-2-naphthoate octaprenyltransferase
MSKAPSAVSWRDWVAGARVRTLPLAFTPVILGSGSAWGLGYFDPGLAALALGVALALQIGVNFANDYSDGIRGTDDHRVGPERLTASGRVAPGLVLRAGLISFALALTAGLGLLLAARAGVLAERGFVAWLVEVWVILAIGVIAVIAAWFYTGGSTPYGYSGWGELVVFVFFGPVATLGTAWAMVGFVPLEAGFAGAGAGFFASAVLLVNNIRDIEQDRMVGKKTLAVKLGLRGSHILLLVLLALPYLMVGILSLAFFWVPVVYTTTLITLWVLVQVFLAKYPADLIKALGTLGLNALAYASVLAFALAW